MFATASSCERGSPKYLRELCDALIPLKKTWGCAMTWNVVQDADLVRHMARAGCRETG